jgi:glutathione S-transferase
MRTAPHHSQDPVEPESHQPSRSGVPVLWHLKVSHYNEKVRWALDYKGVPHVRRAKTAPNHRKIARRLWGGSTFPVLEFDGTAVGDSTEIIQELERRVPEPALYPDDVDERHRALELEDYFDEELGPHLRLLFIHHALRDPELLFDAFAPNLDGARRAFRRATYPIVRRKVVSTIGIDDESVALAWEKLHRSCERFAAELQPNGHLVGDGFTVADLAVAALFSPVVAPVEFPYPQPQRDDPRLADIRAVIDESGAGAWTRGMYARYRGESCEVTA